MEITLINKIPKNIFVLIIAKIARHFDIFLVKSWVTVKRETAKIRKNSNEKRPNVLLIIMNQKEKPAVTAIDLKRGDDNSIFKSDKWMQQVQIVPMQWHQLKQLTKQV